MFATVHSLEAAIEKLAREGKLRQLILSKTQSGWQASFLLSGSTARVHVGASPTAGLLYVTEAISIFDAHELDNLMTDLDDDAAALV